MSGNIFGDLEEKKRKMKESLSNIDLTAASGEGKVRIQLNAAKEIKGINITDELLSPERKDELEDLLIMALEDGLNQASVEEHKISEAMINDIMPGMGKLSGLGDLFK